MLMVQLRVTIRAISNSAMVIHDGEALHDKRRSIADESGMCAR